MIELLSFHSISSLKAEQNAACILKIANLICHHHSCIYLWISMLISVLASDKIWSFNEMHSFNEMPLTAQVMFVFCVFCSYSTELNWLSKFYWYSYRSVFGFCIALRQMMGFYCKNIWFGFQSTKAGFLMLACVFMVLEYCLVLRC